MDWPQARGPPPEVLPSLSGEQRAFRMCKIDSLNNTTQMRMHSFTQRGQADLPLTREQWAAQVSFEHPDSVRYSWLSDAATSGSAREVAFRAQG
jgi:hypothetical protein